MGYLKSTGTVFIYIGLFLTLITFLPGLPPNAQFSEYTTPPLQQSLVSQLEANNRLNNAEILFNGELKGPESFASYNGELYTSIHGGDVVKIVGKHVVPIVKFGKPCDGYWMEKECGRPLGLEFDKKGALYVIDTYNGIFKVDVTSGKYEKIVDISMPIDGVVPKLPNDLDIAANGDIYWTDSTSDFYLEDGLYSTLGNPSGRLIKYDAATKKNSVLVVNLAFANGVKLSKDESFVLVAESFASRITKYHIKGPKAGGAEPFIQGLPGMPDNIHSDGKDGFLVAFIVGIDANNPFLPQTLAPHPYIRKMLMRFLYLLEAPIKLVEDVYPNYYSKRAVHWIGHFESVSFMNPEFVNVLHISVDGKVVGTTRSDDGKISGISSAYIFKDHLYLGSPFNEYIARVPLGIALPSIKTKAEKVGKPEVKETVKPAKDTKPVTTPSQQQEELRKQQQQKEEQLKLQRLQEEKQKQQQQQQKEEQLKQQRLQEEQRKKQQQKEEELKQQRLQEEQRKQQQLKEEEQKQQRLQEEQRKQQQLKEEQQKQQRLQEEQRKQQQQQEELRKQQQQQEELRKQQQQQEELRKQQKQQEEQRKQQQQEELRKQQQQEELRKQQQQQEEQRKKQQQQQQEELRKQQQQKQQQPPQKQPPQQQQTAQQPPQQQQQPPQQRPPPQQQQPPPKQQPPQ